MVGWGATPLKHFFFCLLTHPRHLLPFPYRPKNVMSSEGERMASALSESTMRKSAKIHRSSSARCHGNSTFSHFSYPCSCSERVEILSNVKHNSLSGKCTQHDKKASRHDELLRVAGSCYICF